MMPKDKTLNQQLIDHIDMLYKMIEKMNVKMSVENKAIKSSIAKIGKRVDKVEKESQIMSEFEDDLIKVVKTMEDLSYMVSSLTKQFTYLDNRADDTDISIQYILKELRKNELYKLRNKEDQI